MKAGLRRGADGETIQGAPSVRSIPGAGAHPVPLVATIDGRINGIFAPGLTTGRQGALAPRVRVFVEVATARSARERWNPLLLEGRRGRQTET